MPLDDLSFEYDVLETLEKDEPGELYHFCRDIMGDKDLEPQPHAEICNVIQAALGDCQFSGDEQTLVMIGVPRGCFKTTICTKSMPVYVTTKNPNARGLITSFRHDVSKKRLAAVRWQFEHNEAFKNKFGDDWKPEFREGLWNDDSIIVTRRTRTVIDPTVGTAGTDRDMTGAHYDYIIADDLVTRKNVYTAEGRDKVYQYIQELLPILEPGGVLILVFTRWHPDDAYGRIIRIDEERVRQGQPPEWTKVIHGAYNTDGTLYFPARHTHDFLDRQRRRMGPKLFAAQYLNQPISDEDKTFKMDRGEIREFSFYQDNTTSNSGVVRDTAGGQFPVECFLLWDPAGRKFTRKSDYHAFCVVGCDPTERWWVLEAEQYKDTPTKVLDRVCTLLKHYNVRTASVEDINGMGMWYDLLQKEIVARGLRCGVKEYTTGGIPKGARIEMLEPLWERKHLVIHTKLIDLRRQMDGYSPAAPLDHEDILDALAQGTSVVRKADEVGRIEYNPKDPEWESRQKRLRRNDPNQPGLCSRWGI